MDQRLKEQAQKIDYWIEQLSDAEEKFFNLEASTDALWGEIFLEYKEGSVEQRKALTNSDKRMKTHNAGLAEAKKLMLRARRKYELAKSAGDWEYGTFKIEESAIRRQRGA